MRTLFTLLTVTCLAIGCSDQQPANETAQVDSSTNQADADSSGESAKTSAEAETAESEETATADATTTDASASEETPAASEESKPLVIDVRTQAEWDEGHLAIATHIPLDQIADRIGEVAPDKDQQIYLHCRSGGRSGQAKTKLEGLGYTSVENVGGLDDARAKFESSGE
jgi:phage shock protein E